MHHSSITATGSCCTVINFKIKLLALILSIDTARETAIVCISRDGILLAESLGLEQKNHASFIQPAILQLMATAGLQLNAADAIAVVAGPGSYTGLRVGLSTAKGFCYALGKPLILLNTLEVMAHSMITAGLAGTESSEKTGLTPLQTYYCPMIDARRMEVYTGVYDQQLTTILPPTALVLTADSFSDLLENHNMVFSGNGAAKFSEILHHPHARFVSLPHLAPSITALAEQALANGNIADLAYAEPFYCKEFFTKQKHI